MDFEGSFVKVQYPGGEIVFHKDLKKYYEIYRKKQKNADALLANIAEAKDPEGMHSEFSPKDFLEKITGEILGTIEKEFIPSLSKYGLYDLTDEDFLLNNSGYSQIFHATQDYNPYFGVWKIGSINTPGQLERLTECKTKNRNLHIWMQKVLDQY